MDCLIDANELLENYPSVGFSDANYNASQSSQDNFNLALFEEWSKFSEIEVPQKPPIRVIQHLSCTGGTLLSKCLAAMPNVALLSEVNPLSKMLLGSMTRCAPTDLTFLAKQGGFPLVEELSEKIFRADINVISEHVKQLGKHLLIREHSHSDYLVGKSSNEYSTIRKLLNDDYPMLSVLTVRHPVDSYLSLLKLDWITFTPKTFEEYCKRYLSFIKQNQNIPLYKYEDFVENPSTELRHICQTLELPFNENFQDVFDVNAFSGDSGRSSSIIEKRERRQIDEGVSIEINESAKYLQLCELLKYES